MEKRCASTYLFYSTAYRVRVVQVNRPRNVTESVFIEGLSTYGRAAGQGGRVEQFSLAAFLPGYGLGYRSTTGLLMSKHKNNETLVSLSG